MKVVLMRKLAKSMDGVDVSARQVGDVLELPPSDANMLMAEGWAVQDRRTSDGGGRPDVERRRRESIAACDVSESQYGRAS